MTVLGAGAVAVIADRSDGAPAPVIPRFVDETAAAGIDHRYDGEVEFFEGGGVAAFDCDDDGRPELYFAGGSGPAALYRNESTGGGPLRFNRLALSSTDLTGVTGAYPLDLDSDGLVDLAVLRDGEDVILRGRGDCAFERANEALGIEGDNSRTMAFSATWEGESRLPTLAFGDYLAPDHQSCESSRLFRPDTTGASYAPPLALAPGYCTLSVLFSDWQRTGRRDLRVTNDRNYYRNGTDQLWRVEEGVPPSLYTDADGWRSLQIWGMGIASHDVTGDGLPEVFLTSQGDHKLQTLVEGANGPTYEDMALRAGVTAHRPFVGGDVLPSTGWHAEFRDVNNDSYADLFIAKGNVEAQPDHATRDPSNLLLGTEDGTFTEAAEGAGIVDYRRARGAALVDLDLDGLLDLVVVHRRENVTVWRNTGGAGRGEPGGLGHWIAVRIRQSAPNVDAIGAWIEVKVGDRTLAQEITVGGGHAGGQLGWVHVGLGEHERAELRVQWPDGSTGPWMTVDADQFVTLERDASEPTRWSPGSAG